MGAIGSVGVAVAIRAPCSHPTLPSEVRTGHQSTPFTSTGSPMMRTSSPSRRNPVISPAGASRRYPPKSPVWITMARGGSGVAVAVKVGVTVGVADTVGVALAVKVAVIVGVPEAVGVNVGVTVGVGREAMTE